MDRILALRGISRDFARGVNPEIGYVTQADPQVILMDEPFGPLDAQTLVILQDQLLPSGRRPQDHRLHHPRPGRGGGAG